jgi:hypothetical protein
MPRIHPFLFSVSPRLPSHLTTDQLPPSQVLSVPPLSVQVVQCATTVVHQGSVLALKSSRVRRSLFSLRKISNHPIDQSVIPGNIIVRQRGTQFHPGQHVRLALHFIRRSESQRVLPARPR